MRYLGIDYGIKNVGVALSDEEGKLAFPKAVLPNDNYLSSELKAIIRSHDVGGVVIGESKDYKMKDNPIMRNIRLFSELLSQDTGVPVEYEPEFLSSHQAHHIQGKTDMLDASAAAIILQSYLDKKSSQSQSGD